jgi:c-di-GMP-related signal transduction protein
LPLAGREGLDSSILLGLDVLCGGQRAFINCTREVLLKDYLTLLPPNQAVAEILESVPGDDLVKAACGRLKEAGFMIALDVRMLQAVSQPELDPKEIENVIKSEASICYRLLRYLNSAVFGFPSEIHSVRHALSILGEREVRRWVRLVATLGAGQGKSSELVLSALVRARFCELLAPKIPQGSSDLFLMGLLSLMDAILEIPMTEVLDNVPLDQGTKAVLSGAASPLRPLYQLMLARESGEWQDTTHLTRTMRLSESEVAEVYWQAMQWARQVNAE